MTLSPRQARDRVEVASALTGRLPGTLAALGRGDLDYYRARCMVDSLAALAETTPELAAAVEARVLPRAADKTASQLKAALRRAVLAVDPRGAEQRHERALRGRSVYLQPGEDGMAFLGVIAAADDATAAFFALDGLARAARARPAETRNLDQLRADALAGIGWDILANGGWAAVPLPGGRRRAHVQVTVGADTLLGVSQEPGWLAGYGPIPASMARRIASDGTWRRILTDPVTGSLLDYGAAVHDPGVVLAGHVVARDHTCVWTTCTAPAEGCDLDHTVAYPDGPTVAANLGSLHRHYHRAKQAGYRLAQPSPGVFTWTSPTGRMTTRARPALAAPRPDWHRRRPPRGTAGATPTAARSGRCGRRDRLATLIASVRKRN